jgi:hypothetical protein
MMTHHLRGLVARAGLAGRPRAKKQFYINGLSF